MLYLLFRIFTYIKSSGGTQRDKLCCNLPHSWLVQVPALLAAWHLTHYFDSYRHTLNEWASKGASLHSTWATLKISRSWTDLMDLRWRCRQQTKVTLGAVTLQSRTSQTLPLERCVKHVVFHRLSITSPWCGAVVWQAVWLHCQWENDVSPKWVHLPLITWITSQYDHAQAEFSV